MSKHPIVSGIDLTAIRDLLVRHQDSKNRLLLATAIEMLKIPAIEADAFIRKLANAGYLEWVWTDKWKGHNDWILSDAGQRLAADDLGPRLPRQAVDTIIKTVVDRVRLINADPDRIVRVVALRLFGSALDPDREDYGDVDLEAQIEIRKFPADEISRAHALIATRVPQSWRDSLFRKFRAEEDFDRRNVFTAIKRGVKGLSLTKDTTQMLGCEYRRIYNFDLETDREIPSDASIVARTKPAPKSAGEIDAATVPEHTVLRPIGLAGPEERVRSDKITISMYDIYYLEALAWLGQPSAGGTCTPVDTKQKPSQRFAGAQFLFDDWRDPKLSGLELFQRTLDWASHHKLPISTAARRFTLRTYENTRIANFHALMVRRVADRIEAQLVLTKATGRSAVWNQPGASRLTSPRMVAANHALSVAFGRMLDETRLTGQVDFRAEFDLTAERHNTYPRLPDLSGISRQLRNLLPKVTFPEDVMVQARARKEHYQSDLPLTREVEILAAVIKKTGKTIAYSSTSLGADWWEPKSEFDEEGNEFHPFLSGEEPLWDACELFQERIEQALAELPGCRLLSIKYEAPVHDNESDMPVLAD